MTNEYYLLSSIKSNNEKCLVFTIKNKDFIFSHGSKNILPDNKLLVGSYHPSPRNVNTGRINQNKMVKLLNNIKEIL